MNATSTEKLLKALLLAFISNRCEIEALQAALATNRMVILMDDARLKAQERYARVLDLIRGNDLDAACQFLEGLFPTR